MKRLTICLYTLGLMLLTIMTQCHSEQQGIRGVTIDVATVDSDSVWYSYMYGSDRVTIDTIRAHDGRFTLSRPFGTDTIDLITIYNEEGRLLLPIIPERDGVTIKRPKVKDTLMVKGMKEGDLVYNWRLLSRNQQPSPELIAFLKSHMRESVTFIILKELKTQTRGTGCYDTIDSLYIESAMRQSDLMKVTGTDPLSVRISYMPGNLFMYSLPIYDLKKNQVSWRTLVNGAPFYAIQFFNLYDADSLTLAHRQHYLDQLDSLKVPSGTFLPNMQELPKGWKTAVKSKNKTAHYLIIDTAGTATQFAQNLRIKALPTIFLVDSTNTTLRTWTEPDSLITFVKTYQEQMRRTSSKH